MEASYAAGCLKFHAARPLAFTCTSKLRRRAPTTAELFSSTLEAGARYRLRSSSFQLHSAATFTSSTLCQQRMRRGGPHGLFQKRSSSSGPASAAAAADGDSSPAPSAAPPAPAPRVPSWLLGAAAITLAVTLAVMNRILFRMALVPLHRFPFFLAQVTTFGYVLVYFSILALRWRLGIVSDAMLAEPKRPFAVMGLLEAIGLASSMAAAAVLPGALLPILQQVFLVWQLSFSAILLGKRYTVQQLFGCGLVMLGVVLALYSGGGDVFVHAPALYCAVFALSTAFPAASSIIKERTFTTAAKRLKGQSLDLFIVNSFSSGFQALFVLLLLPLLANLRGISLAQLPHYFAEGAACMLNWNGAITECAGSPMLPLLYIACNLSFNITALFLLKATSALMVSFALSVSVPLTVLVFSLPLPYLGHPAPLPPTFPVGVAVLLAGLLAYNLGSLPASKPKES